MLKISVSQLASDVATILGENLALDCRPEESPFPDIEDRVRVLSPVVLSSLIVEVSHEKILDYKPLNGNIQVNSEGVGTLLLPDDFLRLVSIKLSGWNRTVIEIFEAGEVRTLPLGSRWKGIKGSSQRPAVVIGINKDGKKCLFLYGCRDGDKIEAAGYQPVPTISNTDILEIPVSLYPMLLKELVANLSHS